MSRAIWAVPHEARRAIWAHTGYEPTPEQLPIHLDLSRIKLVLGGERAGKSKLGAEEVVVWGVVAQSTDFFWIIGPDYELARPEAQHLIEALRTMGNLDRKNLSTPLNGSWVVPMATGPTFVTRTSSDVEKLAGVSPAGILMVEAGQQPYEAFLRCRSRVAERRGPLILSGTMERSQSWYPNLFQRWQGQNLDGARSFSLPTWSNRAIFPEGRDDPEILALEATFPPDVFQERFGAIPCRPATLVFPEFDHVEHVKDCHWDKTLPVQVWVDPGYAGAYACCAIQIKDRCVYVIDEVYGVRKTAHAVIAEAMQRPWWKNVRDGVIDVAGRQHQGQDSHVEIWLAVAGVHLRSQKVGVADGILRLRTFLKDPATNKPRIFFDPRCKDTIAEFDLYRYREVHENRHVAEEPVDANNHCLVGETLIDTPGGRFPIRDLVGTRPWVYCVIDGKLAVRQADEVFPTLTDTPVVKVMMDRGEVICTPDHLFMTAKGEWVRADALAPGQSLMALNRYVATLGYTRLALTGDTRNHQSEHRFVYEQVHGPIPDKHDVHHRDGNYWNHAPENLEALGMADHASTHHAGKTLSGEHRAQISDASRKAWQEDYERRAAIARENVKAAHEGNRGRSPTDETRQKMSEASKRVWADPEMRAKASRTRRGRKHPEDAREKIAQAKRDYWQSPEGLAHKERLREANRARVWTDEQRQKIANARRAENHKVIAVVPWGNADVYDMTVPEAHNFVAGGVVVHNSVKSLVYGLIVNFGFVASTRRRTRFKLRK